MRGPEIIGAPHKNSRIYLRLGAHPLALEAADIALVFLDRVQRLRRAIIRTAGRPLIAARLFLEAGGFLDRFFAVLALGALLGVGERSGFKLAAFGGFDSQTFRLGFSFGGFLAGALTGFFLFLPLQYVLIGIGWYGLFAILIPVYAFLVLPSLAAIAGDTRDFLARCAKVQWALMLAVFTISHAPALLMLQIPGYRLPPAMLLLYLMIVVQMSDVFQYVFGKLFGRTRLAPSISPSKTLEGLVGGGLTAIAIGTGLFIITPFTPGQAAAMSALIVTFGFLGGFTLSAIKRDLGAKDWGRAIEGHGGVLDRLDSLSFAAPVFFHFTRYWFT